MIGIVSTLAHGICRHCHRPISLHQADIERNARWTHDPVGDSGIYQTHCPGLPVAEPVLCKHDAFGPHTWKRGGTYSNGPAEQCPGPSPVGSVPETEQPK